MSERHSIASICDAAASAARGAGADLSAAPAAFNSFADLLDFLACEADRMMRYGHSDHLSALAQTIRAAAAGIAKQQNPSGES